MEDFSKAVWESGAVYLRLETEEDEKETWRIEFEDLASVSGEACAQSIMDVMTIIRSTRKECRPVALLKETDEIIGVCEIRTPDNEMPVLSITLGQKYRGQGYGRMVADALLRAASDLFPADAFLWECEADNEASIRLAKGLGGEPLPDREKTGIDAFNDILGGGDGEGDVILGFRIPRR